MDCNFCDQEIHCVHSSRFLRFFAHCECLRCLVSHQMTPLRLQYIVTVSFQMIRVFQHTSLWTKQVPKDAQFRSLIFGVFFEKFLLKNQPKSSCFDLTSVYYCRPNLCLATIFQKENRLIFLLSSLQNHSIRNLPLLE